MKNNSLKRVYHDCRTWEEMQHNMWGSVENKKKALSSAIKFTSDHKKYGRYMQKVIREWPISCENALTDKTLNQKAWIGHAAVALALRIPEDITRKAWGSLTDEQRLLANKEAARAICDWEESYRKDMGIREDLEEPMLF